MMSGADEFLHQVKHAASQQAGDDVPVVFGHIASYDAKLHRVRLVIPSWRDEAGNAVLTGWMPLTSGWVGGGFGMQFAPVGGASVDNPTQGEPCVVSIVRKNQGVHVQAGLFFNQANLPPFTDLKPGEGGFMAKSGSFVRFNQDNSVVIDTTQNNGAVTINCGTGHANVNCDTATVTATTEIDLTAPLVKISQDLQVVRNLIVGAQLELGGAFHGAGGGLYAGDLHTSGEVVAKFGTPQSVSATGHVHAGVTPGSGSSSAPTGGT